MLSDIDYHLFDLILVIDYLVFTYFFRCAIYPILPSSCILIPDPWDPACCRVPSCPPSTVTTEAQNQNPETGITTASDINS